MQDTITKKYALLAKLDDVFVFSFHGQVLLNYTFVMGPAGVRVPEMGLDAEVLGLNAVID